MDSIKARNYIKDYKTRFGDPEGNLSESVLANLLIEVYLEGWKEGMGDGYGIGQKEVERYSNMLV